MFILRNSLLICLCLFLGGEVLGQEVTTGMKRTFIADLLVGKVSKVSYPDNESLDLGKIEGIKRIDYEYSIDQIINTETGISTNSNLSFMIESLLRNKEKDLLDRIPPVKLREADQVIQRSTLWRGDRIFYAFYHLKLLNDNELFNLGEGKYACKITTKINFYDANGKSLGYKTRIIPIELNVMNTASPRFLFSNAKKILLKVNNFDLYRKGLTENFFAGDVIGLHAMKLMMNIDRSSAVVFSSIRRINGGEEGELFNPGSMLGKDLFVGNINRSGENYRTRFDGFEFKISGDDLRRNFINKGSYENKVTLKAFSNTNLNNVYTTSETLPVELIVEDLTELRIKGEDVKFKFESLIDFRDERPVPMADHLIISRTSAYDVYIRASGENLVSGTNTIPVSLLGIAPYGGQDGVRTINSISTDNQLLIENGQPALDKKYSLKYVISAEKANVLINKPAGLYVANLIYSITAH